MTAPIVYDPLNPLSDAPLPAVSVINFSDPLDKQCADTLAATQAQFRAEQTMRRQHPLVRLWDGEWHLQFVCSQEYKGSFSWISNDTGPGQMEIPFNSPVAQWIFDEPSRMAAGQGRNIGITVDYCGARWSGIMDKCAVEQREDMDMVLVVDWLHDYEHVKWYSCWSNPFLPAAFQFPRAFLVAGPTDWALKLILFLQIVREHNPLITWPDDPLDLTSWFTDLDMTTWPFVVKPKSFSAAMASGVIWSIPITRWANWHDMAHQPLEDAEMSVTMTRYLEGDALPWEGANLRYGTLVMDIVDKSGVYVGTSHGGTIFDGLARTFVQFGEDFVDSTQVLASDTTVPPEYYQGQTKLTRKELPYVVFREGQNSPIQTSAWINSPAKGIQVNCGGHSMPGVNETISATIQAGFDMLGELIFVSSLGATIDTMLKPLYEDTILAWWSLKSSNRAQDSGWERLFEYFQQGANKAYTIASLMVLRAGFWSTKTTVSWKVEVMDALPFMVGQNGYGHFFLDDRIGLVLAGDPRIHMDRARKLNLSWDENAFASWDITVGDERVFQDPAQRAWGKIEQLIAGLRDLGVY
jgi:hypothetical protein